ncbi:putative porin [Microbulbifer sp. SAOS-129_SWC]|uniref:putative porin n=1 Tax=Microbulbifer sp. SAOS-129_SWC TaxID=3145235 RepID=UPI00321749F7
MKLKFVFAVLPVAVLSISASAEEYRSFSQAAFSQTSRQYNLSGWDSTYKTENYNLGSTYYFGPRVTEGPLNEFEYINRISNVYGGYSRDDSDTDIGTAGGEYYTGNLMFGGEIQNIKGGNFYTAAAGYFFNPDLLVKLESYTYEGDTTFFADAKYNYQLNGTDYLGFHFRTDDQFHLPSFSSKYFKDLGDDHYLALNFSLIDPDDNDSNFSARADYYFSKVTSFGVYASNQKDYGIGVSHFFNRNVALQFNYGTSGEGFYDSYDKYSLGLTVQM